MPRKNPLSRNSYVSCMRDAVASGQSPRACDGLRQGGPSMGQRMDRPGIQTQAMQATPNQAGMLPKQRPGGQNLPVQPGGQGRRPMQNQTMSGQGNMRPGKPGQNLPVQPGGQGRRPMQNQAMSGQGNAPMAPRNVVTPPAQAGARNLRKRGRGPAPAPAPMPRRRNRGTY